MPSTPQNIRSDSSSDSNQFYFFVGNHFGNNGKFSMRSHQVHLLMNGDGNARKLGAVFDQGEQLTAPGADSGPSDSNCGPNFSGILKGSRRGLETIRKRIRYRGLVACLPKLNCPARVKKTGQGLVEPPDSLDHGSKGV